MMTGLGLLKIFGFYIKKCERKILQTQDSSHEHLVPFDVFKQVKRIEWDTLLFFYGVILCIGGLGAIGYLEMLSTNLYNHLGEALPAIHHQTPANIIMGILSAIVDNIPLMFAILTMDPTMSEGQWLLATLTLGIGGSLLSIGSAAGVALMGQTRGIYTFFAHFKWSWAILLGYFAGIYAHILVNAKLFHYY
jgi:Na+/H+ antiporter NhaD/arsenite permease-like protein